MRVSAWMATTLAVFALVTTGCGLRTAESDVRGAGVKTQPSVQTADPSSPPWTASTACPGAFERLEAVPSRLPDRIGTVTHAFLCDVAVQSLASTARRDYEEVRQITAGLDGVLDAFATPDTTSPRCVTLAYHAPLLLWLHQDGQIRVVRAPTTPCGRPLNQATTALEAATTQVVHRRLVRTHPPELDVASGCNTGVKDMLALYAPPPRDTPPTSAPRPLRAGARACTYHVVHDGEIGIGQLTNGRRLSRSEINAVNAALGQSRPDATCSPVGHEAFVLLLDRYTDTYVAVDGCAVAQDSSRWRASDKLRDLLRN